MWAGATNRFVTVTGNVYADGDIAEKSNELQMILDKYMLRPTTVKTTSGYRKSILSV
jgi:putative DNA primase/helicase